MLRRLSDLPRRVRLAGAAAVVAVLALGVAIAVVQVRAADAAERREAAAATLAAEQERAERERAAREQAERGRAEREAAAAWAASVATAEVQLTAADAVLAGSAAQVADDAVRVALVAAMDAVRALLATAPAGTTSDGDADLLDVPVAADLDAAVAAMDAAAAAVAQAQQEWLAAEAARVAEEEAARRAEEEAAAAAPRPGTGAGSGRTLGGPPSTGAGPDCGGPASYEPPKNDGPTFYTSTPSETGDGSNGRIPASQLSPLGWCQDSQGNQQWLRPGAAAALTSLNEAFRAQFGENIAIDMTYRSYEDQVEMREAYGSIAARPGTSNHGTGLAFDTWEWQAYAFGSERYDWLVANGPAYGWVAPSWARQGGSNPEYWHFEYVG
ncbi:M15 family metallopeptidase [Actinotalea solisilvae]|uniref:M15 family metallopeptidase n=1 Tax=Actinotalea solisilvae TaxID=2072922 RepID=UPI0018F26E17|nr:M15 family metallopeptidase [Actinotalea solisilvae]